jgi:hypothetical protein
MPQVSSPTKCRFCLVFEGTEFVYIERRKVACCARCGLLLLANGNLVIRVIRKQ